MKKIILKELQDLVSEVDYINSLSYPILFSTINTESKDIISYEIGIGKSSDEKVSDLANEAFGLDDELQYLSVVDNSCDDGVCVKSYLDIQDPDCMDYNEIEKMLKQKCNIDEKTIIVLHQRDSFSGSERSITYDLLGKDVIRELEERIEYISKNSLD